MCKTSLQLGLLIPVCRLLTLSRFERPTPWVLFLCKTLYII